MDIGAFFLLLALLMLIAVFVSRPFLERQPAATLQEEHAASSLLAERDRILTALQELDFDHGLGKIPAEDYPLQRSSLLQRGAAILRQLDALTTSTALSAGSSPFAKHPSGAPASGRGESTKERLGTAIATRRADAAEEPASAKETTDEDLEALIAKRRASLKDKAAGFCPKCGRPNLSTDSFCPQCGYALK
jgi:hypothetical protein